jgi:hypothetical protein
MDRTILMVIQPKYPWLINWKAERIFAFIILLITLRFLFLILFIQPAKQKAVGCSVWTRGNMLVLSQPITVMAISFIHLVFTRKMFLYNANRYDFRSEITAYL